MRAPKFRLIVCSFAIAVAAAACTGKITTHGGGEQVDGGGGGGSAGKGSPSFEPSEGSTDAIVSGARFARLTHFQWQNAVKDLLLLKALPAGLTLQRDAVLGFDNNNAGSALDVSFDLRGDYERAAETIAAFVVGDPVAKMRLMPRDSPTALEAKARLVIRSLAERAYRRPVDAAEVDELWNLFKQGPNLITGRDAFDAGLEVVISAVLQSPAFLYKMELGEGQNTGSFALTNFEVASRLSFALTDTMPDDELLAAARAGELTDAEHIRTQAQRLLKTPAARASAAHFHEQLFRLAGLDQIEKDVKAFPAFDSATPALLKEEARLFLDHIVANQGTPRDLLTSSDTFVNAKLAAIYGLSGTFANTFQKAPLDPQQRRGLLTQLGFLAKNAGAKDPDPIHRGVFVSEVILCKTLPPPAANVKPVPTMGGGTNRARVEAHTGKGTCGATCHATLINPLGYAFESYDAIGRWRTTDSGTPVDASGAYEELASGKVSFDNGLDLVEALAGSSDYHACYLSNWLQYLFARGARDDDGLALERMVDDSLAGTSVQESLTSLVTNPAFRRYLP